MVNQQLKNHLKNFTVKELKKEVINVKKGFQVSKLRRVDVENVILKNHQHFLHLLKKNKVKKTKQTVKKSKPLEKKPKPTAKDNNTNKQQIDALIKRLNDNDKINIRVKEYITQILNRLDEKAAGKRYPEFIDERYSGVTIQKNKSQYVICDTNDFSNIILTATTDRKKVEDLLYHMLA